MLSFARSVDLFVRQSNDLAIGLYRSLGYMIYRRVRGYYGGGPGEKDEDAYGASEMTFLCSFCLFIELILACLQTCAKPFRVTRTACR